MSIGEFDGPPSWSLDAGEAGESTECPWVVAVGLIAWGCRGGLSKPSKCFEIHNTYTITCIHIIIPDLTGFFSGKEIVN